MNEEITELMFIDELIEQRQLENVLLYIRYFLNKLCNDDIEVTDEIIALNYFFDKSDEELKKVFNKIEDFDEFAKGCYLINNYEYKNHLLTYNEEVCKMLKKLYEIKIANILNDSKLEVQVNECKSLTTNDAVLSIKKQKVKKLK